MRAEEPTYHRHVAPILARHCVTCHKPGERGPFPLTNYEEVRRAGPAIHASIRGGRMPPDERNPHHGPAFFERTLRRQELETVVRWVEAGMPEGTPPKRR